MTLHLYFIGNDMELNGHQHDMLQNTTSHKIQESQPEASTSQPTRYICPCSRKCYWAMIWVIPFRNCIPFCLCQALPSAIQYVGSEPIPKPILYPSWSQGKPEPVICPRCRPSSWTVQPEPCWGNSIRGRVFRWWVQQLWCLSWLQIPR